MHPPSGSFSSRLIACLLLLLGHSDLLAAPTVSAHPQSLAVAANTTANFSVTATGTGTLAHQWQKDGVNIPGATSSSYSLASAKPWHIGDYTVKVTDSNGTVTSNAAALNLSGINSGIWEGLVAYYMFNSNLTTETTGLGQSLTNFQTTQGSDRFGAGNSAASFSVAQSSRLTSTTFFPIRGAGAKTVSAWIKYNGGTPQPWNEGTIVRWGGDNVTFGSVFEFRVASMDSLPGTSLCLDGGGNVTQGNQAIDTSAWRHVVIVNPENSGINDPDMWVDGVLLPKRIWSDPNYFFDTQGLQTLTIGGAPDNSRFFEGAIDEVRIYNRALNPGDISALYAAENASNVWRQTHFGSTARTGSAADNEDPDKDGMPNLLEYALNLPPNAASRVPAAVQAAGGNLEYTYTRGTAAYQGGTTFQVEWSDDLMTWFTTGVVESLISDDGTHQQVKATLPAGSGGRRFVRLRVQ